ncbi:MAG: hypothetical protein J7527_07665, partial [Chitinophagaceae bacterium]|nr:hypothetical protein [Chitinophagaceae bacterium]
MFAKRECTPMAANVREQGVGTIYAFWRMKTFPGNPTSSNYRSIKRHSRTFAAIRVLFVFYQTIIYMSKKFLYSASFVAVIGLLALQKKEASFQPVIQTSAVSPIINDTLPAPFATPSVRKNSRVIGWP